MENFNPPTDEDKLKVYEELLHMIGRLSMNPNDREFPDGKSAEQVIGHLVLNIVRWHQADTSKWRNEEQVAKLFWNLTDLTM